jgi:predicted RecB family nuclease
MRDIPSDFSLTPGQQRVVDAVVSGQAYISDDLGDALVPLGPPAAYLDFETFSPAVPLYAGTSPYQRIQFQWSIHYDDGQSDVRHSEFLAEGDSDPRRDFAQKLIVAIGRTSGPIIAYSPFEAGVLHDLAALYPDLSLPLLAVFDRICDLLPIVRTHVAHPAFLGSYSIKVVAPALVPGFSYDDPDEIAHGDDASAIFYRLASDRSLSNDDRARYRQGLLRYCGRDTLAMLCVHSKLLWHSETNTVLEGEGHGARADSRGPDRV